MNKNGMKLSNSLPDEKVSGNDVSKSIVLISLCIDMNYE